MPYGEEREVAPGVRARFHDAGHILGSAIVEVAVEERPHRKTLVFSGDLGNPETPILRDPAVLHEADVLVLESTYGDRNHRPAAGDDRGAGGDRAAGAPPGGQGADPRLRGRAQPGADLSPRRLAARRAPRCGGIHRQPDGDRHHRALPAPPRVVRRGGARAHRPRHHAARLPVAALLAHPGGVPGAQRASATAR